MNQRDVELLSAYLDGQLKPSDSARLEVRLKAEPELVSVMDDLRAARSLLRQLPQRRAPRSFALTRKMVGQNPPMPRAYPIFRFATAIATLLFVFTFGVNFLAPQLASQAPVGMGGGGGGGPESFAAEAPADSVVTEAPAATEAPIEPPVAMAPAPTQGVEIPSEESTRVQDTPSAKNGETENTVPQEEPPLQQPQKQAPLVSSIWQVVLAIIAVLGTLLMLLMRQMAVNRWRKEK